MAANRTWGIGIALLLLAAPAADASYKYTATIRFSGTASSDELDAGAVVSHVQSRTRFSVRDARLVVTVKAGAIALFPSGHTTAHLQVVQSGHRTACEAARQDFSDHLARRPKRAWITLRRRGSRASLGFGWAGESVDRSYRQAVEGDCVEPADVEPAGGNADEAGSAAMLTRFGVGLRVPLGSLMAGRSVVRRTRVHRVQRDVLDGSGVESHLDGTYSIVLARAG